MSGVILSYTCSVLVPSWSRVGGVFGSFGTNKFYRAWLLLGLPGINGYTLGYGVEEAERDVYYGVYDEGEHGGEVA